SWLSSSCVLGPNSAGSLSGAAGFHVFGYEGRDVNVSCHYDEGYQGYEKYLCRNDCGDSDVLIMTGQTKKGRYSIYDDKKARKSTVTISDLRASDSGTYWCGVTRTGKDLYNEVKLEIRQVVLLKCCVSGSVYFHFALFFWFSDVVLYVVVTVSAVSLIVIFALVIACKYKRHKVQGISDIETLASDFAHKCMHAYKKNVIISFDVCLQVLRSTPTEANPILQRKRWAE
uniref:Immunoglobulin domain-containing protein n=1 Tax=Acanthochromis polyacanthus TaxID=80966 RepID=A0A3Q1GB36_9TELE